MHRDAFVVGVSALLASVVLTFVVTRLASSYGNLQPLAIITLILLVVGTVVTIYSIKEDVFGRRAPPKV